MLSILVLLSWKTLRRWLIAGIPPMVVPCTDARIAANSNSLPSAVMQNFAPTCGKEIQQEKTGFTR